MCHTTHIQLRLHSKFLIRVVYLQMQEQQADLQHQLQLKTDQIAQAADRFQPVMENLHKARLVLLTVC